MPIRSYRDIEAYQRAKALVVPMHKLVTGFPAHERFDLCDQIRRTSKSVVTNIVEGYSQRYARQSQTVLAHRDGVCQRDD